MKKLLILLPVIITLYWWTTPQTVQGPSSEHEFEYIVRTTANASTSDILPLIIALHGNGDSAENFFDSLLKDFDYPARFVLLRAPLEFPGAGRKSSAWPMKAGSVREYCDAVADAVPVLAGEFPTKGKPVVLGFSGGAICAYCLAAFHSELFSYIFPLSGKLPGGLITPGIATDSSSTKVIAFHGTRDQVIGYNQGKAAVSNLKQGGINADLVTFNGVHLDIFMSAKNLFFNQLRISVNQL